MNLSGKGIIQAIIITFMFGVASMAAGCFGSPAHPEGLAKAGGGTGPQIIFDPLNKPIPEVPFPIDVATILDDSMLTGRRVNIPEEAPTELERSIRRKLNTLDGFGTYSAITVRFDKPLNLATVNETNIIVIKLAGADVGKVCPLDLGKGFFPSIWQPYDEGGVPWWWHDTYNLANNMMFKVTNVENGDENGNGTPNEFIDYYEKETNTLIIRPIVPLDEASRYAVVLLNGMTGLDGQPVRSAFEYINHTMQTDDLQPLVPLLQARGIPLANVAFTWSFTTQSISPEWLNVWDGLVNGVGPLASLSVEYPPVITPIDLEINIDNDGRPHTLNADWFEPVLKLLATLMRESGYLQIADFRFTDYFVFGTFESPSFFDGLDFGNPLFAPPHSWDPARLNGSVPTDRLTVPFMLSVPRDEDLGIDGCQNQLHGSEVSVRPQGCEDYEENGAKGPDGGYGVVNVDDNGDTVLDDEGEYNWAGSDDVADAAQDNYDPSNSVCVLADPADPCVPAAYRDQCTQGNGRLDADCGPDGVPGNPGDDDGNGIVDDISEFGWAGSDDGLTEDANQDGRLNTPPFPVAFYGHGHTSGGVESIGFAGPMNQFGIALFGMDNFGHGPFADFADLVQVVKQYLEAPPQNWDLSEVCVAAAPSPHCYTDPLSVMNLVALFKVDFNGDKVVDNLDIDGKVISDVIDDIFNLGLFRVLSTVGRGYDIDGDTKPDSGAIFWTANIFQTRDLMRQTAVDWFQFSRIADLFGTMTSMDMNGDTVFDMDGDYNLDGRADLGGPTLVGKRGHYMFGSSLGGIMGVLNMGVNPRMVAGAPVAGAGGLPEVIPRSHQGSANKPVMRQISGPVIAGKYEGVPGKVKIFFYKEAKDEYILTDPFGFLYLPPYGRVQVTNLNNGEVRIIDGSCNELPVPVCNPDQFGNFSVPIPSDAGDLLEIVSLDDTSGPTQSKAYVISPYQGTGLKRNDPDMRRFIALAQWAIERGDPVNFAKHYFTNELGSPLPGSPEKGVLLINTTGDHNVPINTGNAIASAAGLWSMTDAQYLISKGINLGYTPPPYGTPLTDWPIFDPEDLDDDGLGCGWDLPDPRCDTNDTGIAPLPVRPSADGKRVSAVRWPYVEEKGHHAFALPGSINHGIDWGFYMANQIGFFFASDGSCIIDDPIELYSAEHIRPGPNGVLDSAVAGGSDDHVQTVRDMRTLGLHPCNYNFPQIQVITTGPDYILQSVPVGDDQLVTYGNMNRGPLPKQ